MNTLQWVRHGRSLSILTSIVVLLELAAISHAALTVNQLADAPAWPGTPIHSTTGNLDLMTDFNVEVEIPPLECEGTGGCNGAAAHTFVATSSFQLDKFTIRLAGAPTTGEIYLYPEPVGGTDADGFVNVSFSTSLLNGGAGLPFTFNGTATRSLMEFDLTGADEIFLSAGTKYAIDIRHTGFPSSVGSMYWMRAGNAAHLNDYLPGNIYATTSGTQPGERYDVGGGRRDGTLALYAAPPPGMVTSNVADAAAWPGAPVHTTTGSSNLQTDFNTEVTLGPGGAVTHTFTPDATLTLDKFMIRAAGAPTTGELYLYQEPVGGTEADGFVNVGFSTSLLNGGSALPFSFSGTATRTLLEFDLLDANEITLEAGVTYALDLRNTGGGTMYWTRDANPYSGGNIYAQNPAPDGQRFDVADGRRDGALAIFGTPIVTTDGDFNGDGFIDAADYVVWRKRGLPEAEYDIWVSNFGEASPGAGGGVPEPTTWVLAILGACLIGVRRPAS
jgi:hypothetical protein